jgi:hypothetical protein
MSKLHRSIKQPIREGLTWEERWRGPDNGLIFCWERGREERLERPKDAKRAENGELVGLVWKGGVKPKPDEEGTKKLKTKPTLRKGTLRYLATWQGIRGEDLDIDPDGEAVLTCTKTGQAVAFSAAIISDEE